MGQQGWIKLHRKIKYCYLWQDNEPFDKRSAWIDLILNANHANNKTLINNQLVLVKRGEFITSEVKLSERWKWDRGKVRRFLKLLETDNMISKTATSRLYITIQIINYDEYQDATSNTTSESIETTSLQGNDEQVKPQETNKKKTSNEQVTNINKNEEELKNDKESNICDYSELVSTYPGKKTKSVRDKKLPSIIKKYSYEEILRAIQRYAKECVGKDKQYILNESTFWNGRYLDYLDENYKPKITKERLGVKPDNTKLIRKDDY